MFACRYKPIKIKVKSMETVKTAVIGVGGWGKNHVRVFYELDEAELVAICDIDPIRLKYYSQKYRVKGFKDYKELIKTCKPEVVTICTPTITHAKIAIDCIKAGVATLIEKPIAASLPEAINILRIVEEEGVLATVGFIERFNPGVDKVKELIDDGAIGKIVLFTSKRVSRWPQREGDVGVVKDLAIHDIDLARYIIGEEPNTVFCMAGKLRHKIFEDYATIILTFGENTTAVVEANWITPRKIRKLSITGTEGLITLDYLTQQVTVEDEKGLYQPKYEWKEPLKIELLHFLKAFRGIEKLRVTVEDGVIALLIAEEALKSSTKNEPVKIEFEKIRG